jgi:tetratricopeptide (TPR) repeat protein
VPSSVWVDEDGVLVRPAEPSNILEPPLARMDLDLESLPPERREAIDEALKIRYQPEKYVAALRDWARQGAGSRYALSAGQVVARSRPQTADAACAAAHFELGEYLHRRGEVDDARGHWREAHRLQPENWTYKRQAWDLIDPVDAGMQYNVKHVYDSNWIEDVKRFGAANYYPPLDMPD